jgi:hypothetical protein
MSRLATRVELNARGCPRKHKPNNWSPFSTLSSSSLSLNGPLARRGRGTGGNGRGLRLADPVPLPLPSTSASIIPVCAALASGSRCKGEPEASPRHTRSDANSHIPAPNTGNSLSKKLSKPQTSFSLTSADCTHARKFFPLSNLGGALCRGQFATASAVEWARGESPSCSFFFL